MGHPLVGPALYERSLSEGAIAAPGHPFRIEHVLADRRGVAGLDRPEQFAAWFAPDHSRSRVRSTRAPAAPSGVRAPDGTAYPMEGEYDAVDAPHRISYAARPLAEDGSRCSS